MLICKHCNNPKNADEYNYYKSVSTLGKKIFRRKKYCKECEPKVKAEYKHRNASEAKERYHNKSTDELFKMSERYRRLERYYRNKKNSILDYIKNKEV